jgi:DNA repair protein RecO (recombination protein O)
MEERAHGIILRTRPLTETSLIVQWLTTEHGRVATVAKGARRAKSPFAGKLDLYYEADFLFQRARKSTLHNLRELSLTETRPFLRTEWTALEQAAAAGRLIEKATEEETPLAEIFDLFQNFLNELGKAPLQATLSLIFETKLLEILGFAPNLAKSSLKPDSTQILTQFSKLDWPAARRLKLSASQATEISAFLENAFREAMR